MTKAQIQMRLDSDFDYRCLVRPKPQMPSRSQRQQITWILPYLKWRFQPCLIFPQTTDRKISPRLQTHSSDGAKVDWCTDCVSPLSLRVLATFFERFLRARWAFFRQTGQRMGLHCKGTEKGTGGNS